MKPIFEHSKWGNEYCKGYVYSFLWGKVELEYEFTPNRERRVGFCYLVQWGGDAIYLKSLTILGRSLSLTIWPF